VIIPPTTSSLEVLMNLLPFKSYWNVVNAAVVEVVLVLVYTQ